MYYVYILKSIVTSKYYVGQSQDLDHRLDHHNSGYNKTTKSGMPWLLVYSEKYQTRSEAVKRESYIKRMKSREFIERLIQLGERPD